MTDAVLNIEFAGQDAVIPFQVEPLDVRGRCVQLGPMLDSILDRHKYPDSVSKLLAEAITLTVLLGTALKFDGRFIMQTQTDGPVSMIVTDFQTPDSIRAYARYDEAAIALLEDKSAVSLLGRGTLAMTIDQGEYTQRYQGIVQLDGTDLEDVARQYFRQSEQIPTDVRLAVGEVLTRQEGQEPKHGWTAGGILVQFLPESEQRMRLRDLHGGDGDERDPHDTEDDDAWAETRFLMKTIDDLELTDADVEPEKLLYRLFHEHGVRIFDSSKVLDNCSCSDDKVKSMLGGMTAQEREESTENGEIVVTCQFCSQVYAYDPAVL